MENRRPIVAVDIDGVIVDTIGELWLAYLLSHYPLKQEYTFLRFNWKGTKLPYNLTELFDFTDCETDGFEWWNSFDLYDNMKPREDALVYLEALNDLGWDVIFVSKTLGGHSLSKTNFIERWFPYAKACILTSEKQYVRCDVLVDDYVVNLNKMPDGVTLFRFRLDFYQKEQPEKPMKLIYNFQELYNDLINWEK